jgi:hypothetical protein
MAWNGPYLGSAQQRLLKRLRDGEGDTDALRTRYARTVVVLQSAGTGKSRMVGALANVCPTISYCLRSDADGASGVSFPHGDPEILRFLRLPMPSYYDRLVANDFGLDGPYKARPQTEVMWHHMLAVGIVQASLEMRKAVVLCPDSGAERANSLHLSNGMGARRDKVRG